jgi:cell wall-associated NlpC family hydrolase
VRERGQISVAAVGAITLVLLGGVLMGYLSMVTAGGGHAQRAADLAAIAAAGSLGANPDASGADLRRAAEAAAAANGGRVAWLRVVRTGSVPRAVDVAVAVAVKGSVPVAGRQRRRVVARARAGVAFSATLPADRFRPVDLRGARGPLAAVAAAEAQVGWPYRWGGESRAEGGFDCSGLVDYAYAAAGDPLPGRPTAADLWRMARPEAAGELAPADLVFVGTGSGAPDHVGMYVGDGMVVVAPHTGARVRYEPLAAGGWDGFARMLVAQPGAPPLAPAVEAAARAHQVPPDALEAELRLGLTTDPDAAARALAAALRRHPGDLEAALAEALGDPSTAALVLRTASGPALGDGFAAAVRLLPTPIADPVPVAAVTAPPAGARVRVTGVVSVLRRGMAQAGDQIDHAGTRLSVQAAAGFRNVVRFGLTGLAAFLPNRHLQDAAMFAGAVWDGVRSAQTLADGFPLGRWSLFATRVATAVGLVYVGVFAWDAFTARRRRDRIWYAAQAASTLLTTAGAMTAGADLITIGAASAEVPPVGVALMLAGVLLLAGACVYREWDWVARGVTRTAGAVLDAGRSVVGALNPF